MTLTTPVPVLRVSDDQRARAFWTGALGFEAVQEAGDPVIGFGIYRSGAAQVFLSAWDGREAPYDRWRAHFRTDDLTGIAAPLKAAKHPCKGITKTEYGMNEIEVADPGGNVVCFGQDAS